MRYIYIPYEMDAPERRITVHMGKASVFINTKLAVQTVDAFMCFPIFDDFSEVTFEADNDTLIRAAYISRVCRENDRVKLRPIIHLTPDTGTFLAVKSVEKADGIWRLSALCDTVSQSGSNAVAINEYECSDLLHWTFVRAGSATAFNCDTLFCWKGDVISEKKFVDNEGRTIVFGIAKPNTDIPAPLSNFISIPAVWQNGRMQPARELENLRVWKRYWQCEPIEKTFEFEARFQVVPYPGNSKWPRMSIRESTCTPMDIQAQSAEAQITLFVGQEPYIDIDFCGLTWHWDAHNATIEREDGYKLSLKPDRGKISLHMFSDSIAHETFTHAGDAIISSLSNGRGIVKYKNEEESIFKFTYQREPYIRISTPGSTAKLIELNFYGLRRAGFSPNSKKKVAQLRRGELLYTAKNYLVYDNCIEDDIYGEPAAWVAEGGRKIYSPLRLLEDFQEPQNKWWRNKTRVTDHSDCFTAPEYTGKYPELKTKLPVLAAAYNVAVDVLLKDVSEDYCLPGEEGLLAASLEQGLGAGGGMWVRDTNQAAFRSMNLLCPEDIRFSLSQIVKKGVANGNDGAAMPAIGIWDYYLATGDKSILFETLAGIIKNAEDTDRIFNEERNLVPAPDVLDAIPEPELNDGFCFATNVFYAHMYICTAKICMETDTEPEKCEFWANRGESMLRTLNAEYWNEECGCFSNGPKGSVYYNNGWWESTGAELSIWPKFRVSDSRQRRIVLQNIKKNPRAFTDYGINMFPYKEYGNFFWNQVWVAWEQGIAVAAATEGDLEFLSAIIFQHIRSSVLTRDFHECIDADTGRIWSWPGLAWHAAGFLGYLVSALFGIVYDEGGMKIAPAIPEQFADIGIGNLRYRDMMLNIQVNGWGKKYICRIDGKMSDGFISASLQGIHNVTFDCVD